MTAWRCFCVCGGSALRFFWRLRIGAMADYRHHGEGEITIGDMTTDQQTACPKTLICAAKFFDLEISQLEIAPIMQSRSFGSGPCRQAFPVGRAPRPGDRDRRSIPSEDTARDR